MQDAKHWQRHLDRLRHILRAERLGIISDFDGTISYFTNHSADAVITTDNARALDELLPHVALLALVSGRSVLDLRQRFERPDVAYYGAHGMEYWEDDAVQMAAAAKVWVEPLQVLLAHLELHAEGIYVQNKGYTASVHYRQAADPEITHDYLLKVLKPLVKHFGFRLGEGRLVLEILPPVEINKGSAIKALIEDYQLDGVIFMGDDVTDLNGMWYLQKLDHAKIHALSVGVVHPWVVAGLREAADVVAHGVDDIAGLLDWTLQEIRAEARVLNPTA